MKLLYPVVVIMSLTFEYFASDMNKQYTYKQKIHAEKTTNNVNATEM